MISENTYQQAANDLKCPAAAIKAVAQVESSCNGFLPSGKPVILFEPHIFWKQLQKGGKDPNQILQQHADLGDILYPHWNPDGYGARGEHQHERLDRAAQIDRTAALQSCSWGKFQIMGFNWSSCGHHSLQDFINSMYHSEDDQLGCFVCYIVSAGLVQYLRAQHWADFALHYNGPDYKRNSYDIKLAAAFLSFSTN